MIFKRAVAKLRAQDWAAITIEIAIVIIGVFIGTQVSNWNANRLEEIETREMMSRLKPELRKVLAEYEGARKYYGLTRRYADIALAGWRGDSKVSDRDFVVAAYQASQIYTSGTTTAVWAEVFGIDRVRAIADAKIRDDLAYLMYADASPISIAAVDTPYRRNVRRVLPETVQDAIRANCGDRVPEQNIQIYYLPNRCDAIIPDAAALAGAAALRSQPQLVNDLRWHIAATASYLANMSAFERRTRRLAERIEDVD